MNTLQNIEIKRIAKNVLYLSEQMLDMSYQSQWKVFSQLEHKRQELLDKLFKVENIHTYLPIISDLLHQVLIYDNKSIVLTEQARSNVLSELLKIRKSATALNNYRKFSTTENLK